jgi:hypothetical protein
LYAGPGPFDIPGLQANPWAVATPATAGIVAYLWGSPPYLSASPIRPHGESNKVLWQGGGLTSIVGHRLDDPRTTARLEFPATAGPSEVDLPSAGCWQLDLQRAGQTVATIDLAVAPPTTAQATPLVGCPVTKPTMPFHPPAPALANPPATYHERWYGTPDLWTMLPSGGQVWTANGLPSDPSGAVGNKMFWWSRDWSASKEPAPAIAVSGLRLDGGGTFGISGGTNAIADFGIAMLVGVEFPSRGCWQVTATYRGHSLTHVLWIEP